MEDVSAHEGLNAKNLIEMAIQKFQEGVSNKTDNELMDLAHYSLESLRETSDRTDEANAQSAIIMAAALNEVNARCEQIFKPVGETPIEEVYGGLFKNLELVPDAVVNTLTIGEPFSDELLDSIDSIITQICMCSQARSKLFRNALDSIGKENNRQLAKEKKAELRQKQKETQMTPSRFWTLVLLGTIGFLIIVNNL